jgi:hypothetical protein
MPACSSCSHLIDCEVVDETKIVSGYYCGSWAPAADSELTARGQIEKAFGPWALRFGNSRMQAKSAKSKTRRRHKNG